MKTIFNNHSLKTIGLIFLVLIGIYSCETEDDTAEEVTIDDPNDTTDDPNDDPSNTTGRFSDFLTCSIITTPGAVNLNPTYTKFLNCSGIPVVGSSNVPDEALTIASETAEFMLTGAGAIRSKLISEGAYIILYEEGRTLNSVPEAGGLGGDPNGGIYRYDPAQNINYVITSVQNLLCDHAIGSTGGNILVHELAHMLDIGGIRQLDGGFSGTLSSTFSNARSNNLWDNVYAATNKEEYFAEGVTIWFGQNWIGPEGGDGFRNEIGTRVQLQTYDSGLYNLISSRITSLTDVPGCRESYVPGTTANCPDTITDIDGNVYEIVNIGPMCWMKENLRTTHYKDGSPIANLTDNDDWSTTSSGAWSHYNNDPALEPYGKLYNGYATTNPAGLCPEGWRVPTIQDLSNLAQYAGGDFKASNLKDTQLWDEAEATNETGYTALPSGKRLPSGDFVEMGGAAYFMSSTLNNELKVYAKSIFREQANIYTASDSRNFGATCRCIQN